MAPTGSNVQPWRFVVVEGHTKRKLAELNLTVYKEWIKMPQRFFRNEKRKDAMMADLYTWAPVYVFVVGTPDDCSNDCPMVCENIMLAARSFGIGSCWVFFVSWRLVILICRAFSNKEGEKVFVGNSWLSKTDSSPERKSRLSNSLIILECCLKDQRSYHEPVLEISEPGTVPAGFDTDDQRGPVDIGAFFWGAGHTQA